MTRKYRRLRSYLRTSGLVRIDFKFDQIEDIIDGRLPDRALEDENWWRGRRRLWASTGFRVTQVHLPQRVVRFRKEVEAPRRRAILAGAAGSLGQR